MKQQICGKVHARWKGCIACKRTTYLMALDDLNTRVAEARNTLRAAPTAIEAIEDLLRDLPRLPGEEPTP